MSGSAATPNIALEKTALKGMLEVSALRSKLGEVKHKSSLAGDGIPNAVGEVCVASKIMSRTLNAAGWGPISYHRGILSDGLIAVRGIASG